MAHTSALMSVPSDTRNALLTSAGINLERNAADAPPTAPEWFLLYSKPVWVGTA
jgi:hypothetical protein